MKITFRPLATADYPLFAHWLGEPHVARWWRDEPTTAQGVAEKYGSDSKTAVFVVQDGAKPIGIIQTYRWSDYPEEAKGFPLAMASIDYLIGEKAYVGRGYGTQMIRQFIEAVVRPYYPDAPGVATSAEVDNAASLGALRKAGFEPRALITGEYGTPERVMVREFTFTERVYSIVRRIPAGRVATYAEVAALAGNQRAARAVGAAMSHNQDPRDVPCHRVVGGDGRMHGYAFGGVESKMERLRAEGVPVMDGRVDLAVYRWRS